MPKAEYKDITLYRRLLHEARSYWLHIFGIFIISLLSTPLSLLNPLPLKIAVDSGIGTEPLPGILDSVLTATNHNNMNALALAAFLLIAIALLTQLQSLGNSLLNTYTGEKLVLNFRAKLFDRIQRLSITYHDMEGTSDSTYRIMYDASAIKYIAIDGVIPFVTSIFTLISMLYVIFRLDRQLVIIALAVCPFLFMVARVYRIRLRTQARNLKKLESGVLSVVQEVLATIRIVKAFGQENQEQERFLNYSKQGIEARIKLTIGEGFMGVLLSMITAGGTAIVLFIGGRHVKTGSLTLGDLLLIMGYLAQLYGPLKIISRKIASLQSHLASAERAFYIIDHPTDVSEKPNAKAIVRAKGDVAFHKVLFKYDNDQFVLNNISFKVAAGTRIGITGVTGAGKTTLVNLLTRFYDPVSGEILLDGVDLRDYKLADLRKQFSLVPQEAVLFSTSIAENIAYAYPNSSKDEIVNAAKLANAHHFITGLEDGYETIVGERGMRLSGGERQRIALARAFIRNAPILIMDEPTSSVDMKTELEIINAIERLMRNRTTFLITHRLTTLKYCDVLLTVEKGNLCDMTTDVSNVIKNALKSKIV